MLSAINSKVGTTGGVLSAFCFIDSFFQATQVYVVRYHRDTVPQACVPTLAQVEATPV